MSPVYICLFALFAVGFSMRNPLLRRHHETERNITEYPFVVTVIRLNYWNRSFVVGSGAVLNPYWIITPAYLLYHTADYQVRAGSNKVGIGGQLVNVSNVWRSDRYGGFYSDNVALLKTAQKLRFSSRLGPISLSGYASQAGRNYTVVGFNCDFRNVTVNSTSSGLHVATAYIESSYRNRTTNITDSYVYAQTTGGRVFNGDLLIQDGKLFGYYLGTDNSRQSDVYANVAAIRAWALQTIKENSKRYEMEGLYGQLIK